MDANDTQTAYETQIASAAADVQLLRRQARQRFIGAAVLVLVAVVGLPFVLDTKPRPVASNIAIEIQAPTVDSPKLAVPATPPAPLAVPNAAPTAAPTASATTPVTAVVADKPAQAEPAAIPAAPSKAEPAKPEPATKADDGARAAALLNGAGYQIQAGSFTDKAKLAEVQAKLDKAGFPNFTQDAIARDGTAHTRIRLGPYPTQAEANGVAARLGKLGIKTLVVKP